MVPKIDTKRKFKDWKIRRSQIMWPEIRTLNKRKWCVRKKRKNVNFPEVRGDP